MTADPAAARERRLWPILFSDAWSPFTDQVKARLEVIARVRCLGFFGETVVLLFERAGSQVR